MRRNYLEIKGSGVDLGAFNPILNAEEEGEGGVTTIIKDKIKRPPKYKVLLHNDDYTTMEFVISVLQSVFLKSLEEAQRIMLQVHNEGTGVCGIYTFEIAETKKSTVSRMAKERGHPLKCTIEQE